MKGKKVFTKGEAEIIIDLIRQKLSADSTRQKNIRAKIRRLGFYATDFGIGGGYDEYDFKQSVTILDKEDLNLKSSLLPQNIKRRTKKKNSSDESYVIDLCDEVLGINASRQHRFDFLRGDANTRLPVDAYYSELNIVVEYREKQHTEEVKFFDKKNTVSGVNRGEQRKIYDQRRRDVLPVYGITLIELNYSDFNHTPSKRLLRDRLNDLEVIRNKLDLDK